MAEDLGRLLLGRYRLTAPLGRGRTDSVWRAYDTRMDREVAVKELRLPADLDAEQRAAWTARLEREARTAARLRHPGIVAVHDLLTGDDGQPWIIMDLVPGPSLADMLAQYGPLSPDRARDLGLRILDALRAAHQAGIVHRGLKPTNVFLDGDRVLLTGFGGSAVHDETALTHSGAPAYMAPEQIRGQTATPAWDLWALGVTLYIAVEGRPPFDGANTGAVLVAIAADAPAPMNRAGPLGPVIRALLRKDPAQRPTADGLHALLARAAPAPPHPAAAPPPVQPSPSPVTPPPPAPHPIPTSPRPRLALLIAAAAVLVVAGTVAALAYVVIGKSNPTDEANKRFAASLGAPSGFT
jgi:eukaryotic-like serine/threonine-protein kinase